MSPATRYREDVEFRTQWRGQPDTRRWKLLGVLLLSFVVHAPLTPLAGLLGLLGILALPAATDEGPVEQLHAIPIDLIEDPGSGAAESSATSEKPVAEPTPEAPKAEPEAPVVEEPPKAKEPAKAEPADAGVDADAGADAEATDAGAGPGDKLPDPVALSGSAGKITDANANVRVMVFSDRIRKHPLGPRLGKLLSSAYQWRDFFGPAGLDPVRDLDRILIAGPQLRKSADVAVVLKYNVSEERVRSAIDALVKRDPKGHWLDSKKPAARAYADRAERVFVLPAPGIAVVVPPALERSALRMSEKTNFPNRPGEQAVTAYLVTPHRALRGLPYSVPKSIQWLRLSAVPTADGGARILVEGEDESEEHARASAKYLTDSLMTLGRMNFGGSATLSIVAKFIVGGDKLLERAEFEAEGKRIRGTVTLTAKQINSVLTLVSGFIGSASAQPASIPAAPVPHSPSAAGVSSSTSGAAAAPTAGAHAPDSEQLPEPPPVPSSEPGAVPHPPQATSP